MKEMTNGIDSFEKTKAKNELRVGDLIRTLNGKKITILGHDNIDVDSVLSGMLMSRLLNYIGIENEFGILEPVEENETYRIVRELIGVDMKQFQMEGEAETRNLLLLDHYETTHKGIVLGCIDHHPNEQNKEYEFMYVKKSCATAYLIYEIMEKLAFPIEEIDAKMIVVAMLVDTVVFRSTKTVQKEAKVAKELAIEHDLDFGYLVQECICYTPIETMTVEEIITNGHKVYNYAGKKVISSYVQLKSCPNIDTIESWLEALKTRRILTDSDMLVFIIFDIFGKRTFQYQIMGDCIKEEMSYEILSRGQDIMPMIEKRYLCAEDSTERKIARIIEEMSSKKQTISTMESCTGGQLASEITNVEGASEVFERGYVTYSNSAKEALGVEAETINFHTVYSYPVATSMAKAASKKANIGIGITGQLGRIDPNNEGRPTNSVWFAISEGYGEEAVSLSKEDLKSKLLISDDTTRKEKKEIVVREVIQSLYEFLKL